MADRKSMTRLSPAQRFQCDSQGDNDVILGWYIDNEIAKSSILDYQSLFIFINLALGYSGFESIYYGQIFFEKAFTPKFYFMVRMLSS